MARKKDVQDDPQEVPAEVAEFMAKIFEQQAEEKARMQQHYQEIMARVDQAAAEAQRPTHLRLVPKQERAAPRPKYNPDEEEAYLVEWAEKIPGLYVAVEEFRHRRRLFEQLVAAREEAGLTQAEVARRMGMPRAAIERLELGGGNPYFSTIERYVAALGKKIEWRFT